MRLESFVKTTGGKGLHVVVPLDAARPIGTTVKAFAQASPRRWPGTARALHGHDVKKRAAAGRIFSTTCATDAGRRLSPPIRRARAPGAPVSTPLAWDELSPAIRPSHFTVANLPTRLRHLGSDPWDDIDFSEAVAAADCEGHKPALISTWRRSSEAYAGVVNSLGLQC